VCSETLFVRIAVRIRVSVRYGRVRERLGLTYINLGAMVVIARVP